MRAYVLSIGSELILGYLTDTNATYLAQELAALGIELVHVTQVGDDLPRLTGTLRVAAGEADLVVCTGGVGPTDDDLTREAIAELVGQTPAVDPVALDTIRAFFAGRGLAMAERNAKQAWLIPAAEALPNPVGTAPGWFVRHDGKIIVAMPGVPREMFRMWREQVVPRLESSLPPRAIRSATIRTLGIGESALAQLLDDLTRLDHPMVGTYAKDDGVQVRVTVMGPTAVEAVATLTPMMCEIRSRLRKWIYAEDERPLPTVLADLLRARGLTLGVGEAGTGGRFGSLLLGEPNSGDAVLGALARPPVAATSAEVTAQRCASEARDRFAAAIGLGIASVTEPTELGLYEGTVVVALAGEVLTVERFPLRAAFGEIQRRAALHAADVLRRALARDDNG